MSNEGSIQVRVGQKGGITQAILNKLKQEGTVKGNLSASIWGQIMDTIKEDAVEQDKKQWKKGSEFENPTKDKKHWQKNFVVTKGQVLEFSKDLWNKIVSLATTGKLPEKKDDETPAATIEEKSAAPEKTEVKEEEKSAAQQQLAAPEKPKGEEEAQPKVDNFASTLSENVLKEVKELTPDKKIETKTALGEKATIEKKKEGDVISTEKQIVDGKVQDVEIKAEEGDIVVTSEQKVNDKTKELISHYDENGDAKSIQYVGNTFSDVGAISKAKFKEVDGRDVPENIPYEVITPLYNLTDEERKEISASDVEQMTYEKAIENHKVVNKKGKTIVNIDENGNVTGKHGWKISDKKAARRIRKFGFELNQKLNQDCRTETTQAKLNNGEIVQLTTVYDKATNKKLSSENVNNFIAAKYNTVTKTIYDENENPEVDVISFEELEIEDIRGSRENEQKFLDDLVKLYEEGKYERLEIYRDNNTKTPLFVIGKDDAGQTRVETKRTESGTEYVYFNNNNKEIKLKDVLKKLDNNGDNIGLVKAYHKPT